MLAAVGTALAAGAPAHAANQNVAIVDFAFQPGDVSINVNEAVTWINQSGDSHTVTSDNGVFDSGVLSANGGGYQLTFQRAGTFPYHCGIHPQMRGVVHVGGGPTPPPPTTAPTTRPTPTTAKPPVTTPPPPTSAPPPVGSVTTVAGSPALPFGVTTTTLPGSTTSSSTSSSTSTTEPFTPTNPKQAASNSSDDHTKRRAFGAVAAALAALATLGTIFVARRPA